LIQRFSNNPSDGHSAWRVVWQSPCACANARCSVGSVQQPCVCVPGPLLARWAASSATQRSPSWCLCCWRVSAPTPWFHAAGHPHIYGKPPLLAEPHLVVAAGRQTARMLWPQLHEASVSPAGIADPAVTNRQCLDMLLATVFVNTGGPSGIPWRREVVVPCCACWPSPPLQFGT
jgi:hypothetical protein